jgi:hypothetical protein
MVTIKDGLPTIAHPLAKKLKFAKSEISFDLDCVRKKVQVADLPYSQMDLNERIKFLKGMYAYAKGHRGLVQVKNEPKLNKARTCYEVTLDTRGIMSWPKEENEVRCMMKDLVCGLLGCIREIMFTVIYGLRTLSTIPPSRNTSYSISSTEA